MKRKTVISLIFLLSLFVLTNCLSMNYFPSRVAGPNHYYLGYGFFPQAENNCSIDDYIYYNFDLFLRKGFSNNSDFGIDFKFGQAHVLTTIGVSYRKQFNFTPNVFTTIGVGYGHTTYPLMFFYTLLTMPVGGPQYGYSEDAYITADFGYKWFSLSFGNYRSIHEEMWQYINAYIIRGAVQIPVKKFNIMPFIFWKYSKNTQIFSDENYFILKEPKENAYSYDDIDIGLGITLYFDSD